MTNFNPSYSPTLKVASILLCFAVFPLLLVGAGVTTKGAGMAYPDWPTSDGHLLNPPQWTEKEDTLWEHGHRLIGWFVGMLAITTVVLAHRSASTANPLRLRLAWATLLLIIAQGVLGGLRVIEVSTALAMVHGIMGQVCFAMAFMLAVVSSRTWDELGSAVRSKSANATRVFAVSLIAIVLIQLIFGGWLRHFKADLALAGHLVWLIIVCFAIGWMTLWVMGRHHRQRFLVQMTQYLAILLTVQLFFGSLTFMIRTMNLSIGDPWSWLVPSVHLGMGALILGASFAVAGVARRVLAAPKEPVTVPVTGAEADGASNSPMFDRGAVDSPAAS